MQIEPSIFKAYDIRGIYPEQLNAKVAYAVGVAYAQFIKPKKVVVGRDVRVSGEELLNAFVVGLQSEGVEVTEIDGQLTTELIYFASGFYDFDGAVCVTASHNPREYNGFKMCRKNAETISGDTGIQDIRKLASEVNVPDVLPEKQPCQTKDIIPDYFNYLKEHFINKEIGQFSLMADSNFGMQAEIIKRFIKEYELPLDITYINDTPDGSFPKGRPDPMIPDNRNQMTKAIQEQKVDFGVAWDADADRCFFYDETGEYVDPYYINALFIEFILDQDKNKTILHDPRLKWLAKETGEKYGNEIIFAKSGSAFMKLFMRERNIDFGAEVTAHYFFKDYFFADSGMIPLIWILQILTEKKQSLSALVAEYKKQFVKVDELLFKVESVSDAVAAIKEKYKDGLPEEIDGISYDFPDRPSGGQAWRFNARGSNTEPLLKVNIEAKSVDVLNQKVEELNSFIESLNGQRITS